MFNKIFFSSLILVAVLFIGCAGGVADSSDSDSSAENLSISIHSNTSGRSLDITYAEPNVSYGRAAIGTSNMYEVSVVIDGVGGYTKTKSVLVPNGTNKATVSFDDIPIGEATATATVLNRYHKKWTGSKTVTITPEENLFKIQLSNVGYDISDMATGDLVLSTGGYIKRSDYNDSIDSSAGSVYAALKIGSALYAINQGVNQYSYKTYSQCETSAAGITPISWASENFRMPTKDELQQIYDQRNSWMGIYSSSGAAFGLTTTFPYWSSTMDGAMHWILEWSSGTWTNTDASAGDEYICRLN